MTYLFDFFKFRNILSVLCSPEAVLFSDADEEFAIHDISFHWYTLIGVICVWLLGVSLSYWTGGRDLSNFNFQLVSPLVHRWIPKKFLHTKLRNVISVNDNGKSEPLIQCTQKITIIK